MSKRITIVTFVAVLFTSATLTPVSMGGAAPAKTAETTRRAGGLALGYTVDLLPVVITAASGRMGFSFQTWIGIDRLRLRLVGAHMRLPDAMAED